MKDVKESPEHAGDVKLPMKTLAGYAVRTPFFREVMSALLPEIIDQWAGANPVKKGMAYPLKKSVTRAFEQKAAEHRVKGFAELDELIPLLPLAANRFLKIVSELSGQAASLSPEDKIRLISHTLDNMEREETGLSLTSLMKIINDIHGLDPKFFSEKLRKPAGTFIKNTDFGELLEAVRESREDLVNLVKVTGEELWQYPAKAVCILALVPEAINLLLSALTGVLKPVNNMSPDLLTDVALSLVRHCDGRAVGGLINESAELVRKVHTGSALIGDMGSPALPLETGGLIDETLESVDIPLLMKSLNLLDEIREQTGERLYETMAGNPDLVKELIQRKFRKAGHSVRAWSRRWELMEELFSDGEMAEALDLGLRESDPQEAAHSINNCISIINRVMEINPDVLQNTLTQVTETLDPFELNRAAVKFVDTVTTALKPVAGTVMPHVIRGLTELCTPDENSDNYEEMSEALDGLRSLILGRGGPE